jgi:hypothetical protein
MKLKKTIILCTIVILCSCSALSRKEQEELHRLKAVGITVESPQTEDWKRPANPALAGGLNVFPGFGNLYLATGDAPHRMHYLYGALNFITWPISIIWGVPAGVIDARSINQRDLIQFYRYNEDAQRNLAVLQAGM